MCVILNLRQFRLVVQIVNTGAHSLCFGQLEDILPTGWSHKSSLQMVKSRPFEFIASASKILEGEANCLLSAFGDCSGG
jgi:hypothetical protein